MKRTICLLFTSALISACGSGGAVSYSLNIDMPDQAARDQTASIRVAALIPDDTSSCADLLSGAAAPGDDHNPIEDEITFDYPVEGGVRPLAGVGPGSRLFYAEASDASSELILRGCSRVEAGRGGEQQVTIALQWIETCKETNGGVEICDGVDNDCDEETDEDPLSDMCPDPEHAATTTCNLTCVYECESPWINADDNWTNGCECHPTREGVEWCDGLDNDCDGVIDPGNCQQCGSDADCQSPTDCLNGTCNAGVCTVEPIGDGQACDDGEPCTEGDTCQGGICQGQAKDCSDGVDCTDDTCDDTGQCQHPLAPGFCFIIDTCVPEGQDNPDNLCVFCDPAVTTLDWSRKEAGTPCDDGEWCTGEDTCSDTGVCLHSGSPCQEVCQTVCNEAEQTCDFDDELASCDDGLDCTTNDVCDGQGTCGSTPDDSLCPGSSECHPECALDESGCVYPPVQVVVDCPDSATLDGPAECIITLPGNEGTEACVTCEAERLPMVLDRTDFWDPNDNSCDQADWTLEPDNCRLTAVNTPSCPLFPGGSQSACCTSVTCQPGSGLQFGQSGCASDSWRLSKEIDLSEQGRADLCFVGRRDGNNGEYPYLQGVASEVGGAGLSDFFCGSTEFFSAYDDSRLCYALPGEAFSWGQTLLTLWAEVFPITYRNAWINDVRVVAYPTGCLQNAPIVRTVFSGCGIMGTSEYDGWQSYGDQFVCAEGMSPCGPSEGLLFGEHPSIPWGQVQLNMRRNMDLSQLRGPGKLCFNLYIDPDTDGYFQAYVQSSSGGITLLELNLNNYDGEDCQDYCLDLSDLPFEFFGDPNAQIRFEGDSPNGFMILNDIIFLGTLPCPPAGEIAVEPVYNNEEEGGYRVPVTDEVGAARRVLLNCRWGASDRTGSDEFDFVAP